MATTEEVQAMKGKSKSRVVEEAPAPAASVAAEDLQSMLEEIKRLRLENEEFKKRQKPITFSVNDRGAVAVHGIGKFPFSLYRAQWERIFEHADQLRKFAKEHELELN